MQYKKWLGLKIIKLKMWWKDIFIIIKKDNKWKKILKLWIVIMDRNIIQVAMMIVFLLYSEWIK